jgi:hypothetical protein
MVSWNRAHGVRNNDTHNWIRGINWCDLWWGGKVGHASSRNQSSCPEVGLVFSRYDVRPSECSLSIQCISCSPHWPAWHWPHRCEAPDYTMLWNMVLSFRSCSLAVCMYYVLSGKRRWALNIKPTPLFLSYKLKWNNTVPQVDLKSREACDIRVEIPLHPYFWE